MTIEYVADFETTSVREYMEKRVGGKPIKILDKEKSKAWVCAWGVSEIFNESEDNVTLGRTITDFLDWAFREAEKNKRDKNKTVIFTHNLGFDGQFIIYHALCHRDTYSISDEVRDNTLYGFTLDCNGDTPKDKLQIFFKDSSKIFPMKVSKIGDLYGMKKLMGDWDYNKYRDDKTPISPQEWKYVIHDVLIVCKALADYRRRGFTEYTIASIAYNDRLKRTYPGFNKTLASRCRKKNYEKFRKLFPFDIMPLPENLHNACKCAYFGGFNWINPHFANKLLRNIVSFDNNSEYPTQMRDARLPVGQPQVYLNPSKEDWLFINHAYGCKIYHFKRLKVELKDEWSFPFLMFPTPDEETSIRCQGKVIKCDEEDTVWLTDIDYEIMKEEYFIEEEEIDIVLAFQSKKGQYEAFVNYWVEKKNAATETMLLLEEELSKTSDPNKIAEIMDTYQIAKQERASAKVIMNSPYGKDGTKIYRTNKKSVLIDNVIDYMAFTEKDDIQFYIPSAVFITANGRKFLHDLYKHARKEMVYGDTDSGKFTQTGVRKIMLASEEGKIKIDPVELGAWKNEGTAEEAIFVRQKTYATCTTNKEGAKEWKYTVCGATDDVKKCMDIREFQPGMIISLELLHSKGLQGKLIPVSVPGGVILEEAPFSIATEGDWEPFKGKNLPISQFVSYVRNMVTERNERYGKN